MSTARVPFFGGSRPVTKRVTSSAIVKSAVKATPSSAAEAGRHASAGSTVSTTPAPDDDADKTALKKTTDGAAKEFTEAKKAYDRFTKDTKASGLQMKWKKKMVAAAEKWHDARVAAGQSPTSTGAVAKQMMALIAARASSKVSEKSATGTKRKADSDIAASAPAKKLKAYTIAPGPKCAVEMRAPSTSSKKRKADDQTSSDSVTSASSPAKRAKSSDDMGHHAPTASSQSRKRGSEHEDSSDGPAAKEAKYDGPQPKGLVNHKQACFSNVGLQMLSAATDGKDLDELLGKLGKVETFGRTEGSLKAMDRGRKRTTRHMSTAQGKLEDVVKKAVEAEETEKISVVKHLRSVLEDIKVQAVKDGEEDISPFLFQQVFAFSNTDRYKLSGEMQEDSFENYQALINAVETEASEQGVAGFKSLLEVDTTTKDVCSEKCGHESTPHSAVNNYHSITVPATPGESPPDFQKLLNESMMSSSEQKCPGCDAANITKATEVISAPENLVIKFDRTKFDSASQEAKKITAGVDLFPATTVRIGEHEYEVAAVVMHKGKSIYGGHYTIFRKHGDEWWLLDDRKVTQVPREAVKDGRRGQSVMVLLKKVLIPEAVAKETSD